MLKRALIAVPLAGIALTACTPSTPAAAPSTPSPTTTVLTTTASRAAAPTRTTTSQPLAKPASPKSTVTPIAVTATADPGCTVNPASHPVPTADPYEEVPAADQVRMSLSGVPSGTVKVTGDPVEVDLTVCNDSPVDYPNVAFVFALDHCSCAPQPNGIADGTVQTYSHDQWVTVPNAHTGLGVDYLGVFTGQQPLPKGRAVTVRFRFSYDPSMTSGQGGVIGAVVTPDGPHVLRQTRLSYSVEH